jgi:hypothetical protein
MKIGARPGWGRWLVVLGLLLNALFVASPLYRRGILFTPDLINHVRHTHEYTLALREGQLPPLVAPKLNGGLRIPLFQYYSGTAYTVPGLLGLTGLNAYLCLKVAIILFSFLSALAIFRTLRSAGTSTRAAYLGAATFQLFGFAAVDLYQRGGLPEWMSLQFAALAVAGLCGLKNCVVAPVSGWRSLIGLLGCVTALALFIPCHPTHTVYTGLVVLALAGAYGLDQVPRRALGKFALLMMLAGLISIALTAWFWLPICRDYANLRITGHEVYRSEAETPGLVFWPWHREGSIHGWAPQLGPHISLAVVTVLGLLLLRKARQAQPAVAVAVLGVLVFLVILPKMVDWSPLFRTLYRAVTPWVRPMQWSYRFLMPCALAGAWVVALAIWHFEQALRSAISRHVLFLAALCFLIVYSVPFIQRSRHDASAPDYPMSQVLADSFDSPNATLSYAMLGNDYRACRWVTGTMLELGKDFPLPFEGLPFQAKVVMLDVGADLQVFANGKQVATRSEGIGPHSILQSVSFSIVPGRGPGPGRYERTIRFESNGTPVPVAYLEFRPEGDDIDIHLPTILEAPTVSATARAASPTYRVLAPVEGAYQLPFCYTPDIQVLVNGQPAGQVSTDRFLFSTRLPQGESVIEVRARPGQAAVVLFFVGLGLTGGLGLGVLLRWRSSPKATSREQVSSVGAIAA